MAVWVDGRNRIKTICRCGITVKMGKAVRDFDFPGRLFLFRHGMVNLYSIDEIEAENETSAWRAEPFGFGIQFVCDVFAE